MANRSVSERGITHSCVIAHSVHENLEAAMGLMGLMKAQPYRACSAPVEFSDVSRTTLELAGGFAKESGLPLIVLDAAWHNP
jgi:hypothetical protein